MAPKRAAAHSPAGQRTQKKKQSRARNPFIDDEAEESNSGHDTDGGSSQKSAYSLAHVADDQIDEVNGEHTGGYIYNVDTLGNTVDESHFIAARDAARNAARAAAHPVGPGHALVNTTFTISTATPEQPPVNSPADAASPDSGHNESASGATPTTAASAAPVPSAPPAAATTGAQAASALPAAATTGAQAAGALPAAATTGSQAASALPAAATANAPAAAAPPAAVLGSATAAVVNAPPILPPSAVTFAPDHDWSYGPLLNPRITRMMSFADPGELIYDITRVPTNALITAIDTGDRNDAYMLSVPGRRSPITIWVVGTLTRMYFHDQDGAAPKSVSVNLRPLHNAHLTAANNLLRQFSTFAPGENPEKYDTIRAQRWMNVKRPGDISEHVEKFRAAYDARNALLSPRDRMVTVFPADLKRNDLVLLELHLSRYRKASDNDGGSSKSSPRRRSDNWAAFFMLKSVCLLDDDEHNGEPVADLAVGTWEI